VPASVAQLATTPVKGMRMRTVGAIELEHRGARGDRCFCVIDERNRLIDSKQLGELQAVVADYDVAGAELTLHFPDGHHEHAAVQYEGTVAMRLLSHECEAQTLRGPWSQALSELAGRPLRLVAPEVGADRGRRGAASLISSASIERLAEVASEDRVDARRFRMLIEVAGVAAHEEDRWVGSRARVGEALLALHGNVGRCLITSRDPDTGRVDLPTLDLLRSYRNHVVATEPLPFGIYGEVLEPGAVRVGDAITLEG
jgi:uncharacterized protein YcbX